MSNLTNVIQKTGNTHNIYSNNVPSKHINCQRYANKCKHAQSSNAIFVMILLGTCIILNQFTSETFKQYKDERKTLYHTEITFLPENSNYCPFTMSKTRQKSLSDTCLTVYFRAVQPCQASSKKVNLNFFFSVVID